MNSEIKTYEIYLPVVSWSDVPEKMGTVIQEINTIAVIAVTYGNDTSSTDNP